MIRKAALSVCLMAGCIWCLALVTRADSAQSAPASGSFKPVATVESLMHGQNLFFKQIKGELGKPSSEERNEEIKESAEVLAELANVNRFNSKKEDYRAWATELRDTALLLAAEADKNEKADDGRLKNFLVKLKDTCTACHDMYQ